MVSAEEAAAAKVQSMKRGNDARNQVKEGKAARKVQAMQRGKKSRKGGDALVHVIETGNFARFEKLMESGAEATPDALRAALNSPIRAFGSLLVSNQATWGVDAKMLEVWNRVQKALYPPPPGEDEEEPEEVDVSSEEWQAELATAVYKDDPDGKFFVQRVVALGCYSKSGGRQAHDPTKEKEFDDAVTAREGYGVALMPKGAVYAGHFVAGAREGTGVYKYMDGSCYCGEWKGNQKHGEGRMLFKDGSVYEGAWRYNKRHGHGVYTYTNGDIYYGMWFTGAKHGQGKYLSASTGSRFTGEWKSGQLVSSTVHTSDGSKFFSGFEGGVPSGEGAFVLSNGSVVRGVHNLPPKEEGEEEEEGAPPKVSTWAGGAVDDADHMSATQLAAQFEAPRPPQKKALVIGISYGEGGAFPEPYVEPPEVEAPPAAEEPAAEGGEEAAAEGGEEAAAEGGEGGEGGGEAAAEGEGGEAAAEAPPPPPPPTFFAAAAERLKGVLTGPLKLAAADVTVLAPKDAEDASQHTKEKVSEAIAAMAAGMSRGDVAFVGLLCHGKKMLDMDNDEIEEKEEGLCMQDEVLSNDELAELIAKFTDASIHLCLYIDSCFDGACLQSTLQKDAEGEPLPPLKTPPANFCAITSTLDAYEKPPAAPEEPPEDYKPPPASWTGYFASSTTQYLESALNDDDYFNGFKGSYAELLAGLKTSQAHYDERTANKQLPKIYCRASADAALAPMA